MMCAILTWRATMAPLIACTASRSLQKPSSSTAPVCRGTPDSASVAHAKPFAAKRTFRVNVKKSGLCSLNLNGVNGRPTLGQSIIYIVTWKRNVTPNLCRGCAKSRQALHKTRYLLPAFRPEPWQLSPPPVISGKTST